MFDPFFGIGFIGFPLAVAFLVIEARKKRNTVPSIGTCFLALFAGYGAFVWLMTIGITLFGQAVDNADLYIVEWVSATIAALSIGIPFSVSATRRRRRSSSKN